MESNSEMEAVRRTDEETAASLDESIHHDDSAAFKLCSDDEQDASSSGEMRPRSMSQNVSATSPSAHLRDRLSAVQSKPPRRIKRLQVKAQRMAVEPVSRPRPWRAEVPSLFGPPRSSRRRQEETASIATDEDVENFIECYGATMNITTAWQWNSDREKSLQEAASSYDPPIRTILSTLKVALEQRAERSAEEES